MNASITNVCFLVAVCLFGPAGTVRGAVGFVNASFGQRPQLIANPLSHKANRIDQVLAWAPEGTKLVTFDGRNWLTNEFLQGAWTYPEITLSPGDGALLFSPTNWTQTWVGETLQGELKVWIPAGGSLRSSLVPQSGKLSEQLLFPKVAGTKVYNVDNSGQLVLWATCGDAGWEPEEPALLVGECFYVEAPHEFVWSRAFAPRLTIEQDHQSRGMVLVSQGTSGSKVAIEVSTDLIQWTELKGTELIDPESVLDRWTSHAARFYRLRLD